MKYSIVSTLIAWIFPTKQDRADFRRFCKDIDARQDTEIIWSRYPQLLKHLQHEYSKRKLKVVFLNSENAKWVYQAVYEEFAKNPKFDVQVLITVREKLLKDKYKFLEYKKLAEKDYNFFKKLGFNVDYAFDFKKKEYINLEKFKPDIIFYEQPWDLCELQSIKNTSQYALPLYCAYGSCITNGTNEYSEVFYRDVYTYFLDNKSIKKTLIEHGCKEDALVVCGQPKLDAYLKPINQDNIIWQTKNKKRVIYAPHHSFYKDSILGYGTFQWNYQFLYEFAKKHPEIEFILKPHPELRKAIVQHELMTISEMTQYFKNWESLPNAQIYEYGNYFDMFRTSDLLITDCNSFLYEYLPTKKPVIRLISENSVGHNSFGEKIIAGYYNASNIEELNTLLELILFKNKDPLLSVRERIIAEDLIQPEGGVSKFIANYISGILGGKSCVEICHC